MSRFFHMGDYTIAADEDGSEHEGFAVNSFVFGSIVWPQAFTGSKVTIEVQLTKDSGWTQVVYPQGYTIDGVSVAGDPVEMDFSAGDPVAVRLPDIIFPAHKMRFVSNQPEEDDRIFYYHVSE